MRVLNRVLETLDRVYRFDGALRAPPGVEVSALVQIVHDVSREAELGAGKYWLVNATKTHGIADSLAVIVNPYLITGTWTARQGFVVPTPDEEVWILDSWAELTAGSTANFARGHVSMQLPATLVGIAEATIVTPPERLLIRLAAAPVTALCDRIPNVGAGFPVRLPRGATFEMSSTSGAAAITLEQAALIWVGKIGTLPPVG